MWDQNPSVRFEIDNFLDKEAAIASRVFVAGGCEWYLAVHPKGHNSDHLSLYLYVANRASLRTGWKRSANYYFRVLNESNEELYRSSVYGEKESGVFCARTPGWGVSKTVPLSKFQEQGFLKNDRLIIEVYIKIVEAFDGEGGHINRFQIFAAHVASLKKTFAEHVAKTEYKNTLSNACKNTLSNACSKLSELAEVGAKLDWLKLKFDEVSFKSKNGAADESLVQQLEERIKNLELILNKYSTSEWKESHAADECRFQKLEESVKNLELMELGLKLDSLKSKVEEVSLEKKKSYDADESRALQLEERIKNIERLDLGLLIDYVSSTLDNTDDEPRVQQLEELLKDLEVMNVGFKLDKVALEKKKADESNDSRAKQVEKRVKNLELMDLELNKCVQSNHDDLQWKISYDAIFFEQMEDRVRVMEFNLDSLNTKLEEISKEKKKADGSQVQKLEESVKNVELMVSHLKVELDKKKNISSADGFLLVD